MSGGVNPPPVIGAGLPPDYSHAETKIQLSVRTKVAKGLFKRSESDEDDQDSLWFAYSPAKLLAVVQQRPVTAISHDRP